jgi:hypothetical protein
MFHTYTREIRAMARAVTRLERSAGPPSRRVEPPSRGREVAGIVLLGLALFVGLSVGSLHVGAVNLMGPCGGFIGAGVYALLGLCSYLFAAGLALLAIRCLSGKPLQLRSIETLGALLSALSAAILLHVAAASYRVHGYAPGGLVGE